MADGVGIFALAILSQRQLKFRLARRRLDGNGLFQQVSASVYLPSRFSIAP